MPVVETLPESVAGDEMLHNTVRPFTKQVILDDDIGQRRAANGDGVTAAGEIIVDAFQVIGGAELVGEEHTRRLRGIEDDGVMPDLDVVAAALRGDAVEVRV